jgi:hypothetical protein
MSKGVGSPFFASLAISVAGNSSRMMSLHKSMHSSQMKTEGPAMSFFTSCWLLPQNEQYKFFSETEPFLSAINNALWFYFPMITKEKRRSPGKGAPSSKNRA